MENAILAYAASALSLYHRAVKGNSMLINCAAYQDGRKLADIKPDEISDYVSRPDCFVWVALRDPGPANLPQ